MCLRPGFQAPRDARASAGRAGWCSGVGVSSIRGSGVRTGRPWGRVGGRVGDGTGGGTRSLS